MAGRSHGITLAAGRRNNILSPAGIKYSAGGAQKSEVAGINFTSGEGPPKRGLGGARRGKDWEEKAWITMTERQRRATVEREKEKGRRARMFRQERR